jgi:hypothetical protein
MRAGDFHPVEQHLRFANNQRLDFVELPFAIDDESEPPSESASSVTLAQASPHPASGPHAPGPTTPPAADLDQVEMQLRYTLFIHKWDLGEDP